MTRYVFPVVWMVGFLFTYTTSCIPPGKSETVELITQEEFDQLFLPVVYGYDGGGRISDGIQLGSMDIEISLRQATFNRSLGYLSIAGNVLSVEGREAVPGTNVIIGTVEYLNGEPFRILPKKWVVAGDSGEFSIESKIETGDLLFFARVGGFIMETANISQLLNP